MRKQFFLCSVSWFAIAFFIHKIVALQGEMIGGSQYFAHVGMGSGLTAQNGLMVASIALGIAFGFISFKKFSTYAALLFFNLAVLLGVVVTYIQLAPLPLLLRIPLDFVAPAIFVFPANYYWVPLAAFALGAYSASLLAAQKHS